MRLLPHPCHVLGLAACCLLLLSVRAADQPVVAAQGGSDSQGFRFEISNGVIVGHLVDAKPMPATLNNVVGLARALYPYEMISQIGVGDIPIGNIVMESRRPPGPDAFFAALSIASNRQLFFEMHQDAVLLSGPPKPALENGSQVIEVFNLTHLLAPQTANLEENIKYLESQRKALGNRLADTHPDMVSLATQIDAMKSRIAGEKHSPEELKHILDGLKNSVTEVLAIVSPRANPPEMSFNQNTKLLVVYGSPEAVDVAKKVIGAQL